MRKGSLLSVFPSILGRLPTPFTPLASAGRRALLAAPLIAALPLRATRADEPGQALRRILGQGRLRIALNTSRPPYAERDASGELIGYDVAVARLLAQGLGVEPVFVETSVTERISVIQAGEADIVCHLPVSTRFARMLLLSAPYVHVDISLASPGRLRFRGLTDLDGRSIGVLLGSGAQQSAIEALPNTTQVVRCPTYPCLSAALVAGEVDAVILARASLPMMQRAHPQLALVHRFVIGTQWVSVGVPFGEHDLLRALNGLLFLARTQGRLGAISQALLNQPLADLQTF